MENNKPHLTAQFKLTDKELITLYSDRLEQIYDKVGYYYFEAKGADFVINACEVIINLMTEYKIKAQKFQVLQANIKDNDDEGETND